MDALAIQQIRQFNRTVTEGIGALHDRFLGRARPLGEARLLWEIGPEGAEVRAAMTEVERLLQASMVHVAVEDPTTPDARWCLEQYFAELDDRFDAGFDPALSIHADAHELVPPAGAFFIARLRERPVGCGALKLHRDAPAELKRMWIAPVARGLGVGRRLLQELERHAREAGAAVLRLETNHTLTEAIALYRRSGYLEVDAFNDEPYAHHWFEKRLSRNHRRRRSVARTAE